MKLVDEEISALATAPSMGDGAGAHVDPEALEAEVAQVFNSLGVSMEGAVRDLEALGVTERLARRRHRLTPFYLVMEGEQQYAIVIDPPQHSYLEDGEGLSLADAVMCLDVGKLLLRGPAMA